jgi:hypothetical protein
MTLFERFHAPAKMQNYASQGEPEIHASLKIYLEAALNNRLSAGALEYSDVYQRCLPALMNIRAPSAWSLVADYLILIDQRLKTVVISAPKTRSKDALFILECEIQQGKRYNYECDFLENGALMLEYIEND